MNEDRYYEIHAKICKALAHPTRLKLLDSLEAGEKSVNELSNELGISRGTVSRHLNYMRPWGVVFPRRDGQTIFYRLGSPKIIAAYGIMHEFAIEFLEERGKLLQMVNR